MDGRPGRACGVAADRAGWVAGRRRRYRTNRDRVRGAVGQAGDAHGGWWEAGGHPRAGAIELVLVIQDGATGRPGVNATDRPPSAVIVVMAGAAGGPVGVKDADEAEGAPFLLVLTAMTWKTYAVPLVRPVTVAAVAVEVPSVKVLQTVGAGGQGVVHIVVGDGCLPGVARGRPGQRKQRCSAKTVRPSRWEPKDRQRRRRLRWNRSPRCLGRPDRTRSGRRGPPSSSGRGSRRSRTTRWRCRSRTEPNPCAPPWAPPPPAPPPPPSQLVEPLRVQMV